MAGLYINGYQLNKAASENNLQKVLELLESGLDINAEEDNLGFTALISASKEGHLNMVRELIMRGANVNHRASGRTTALHIASSYNKLDVVRELITNGADINEATRRGITPLMYACMRGHADIVNELIRLGANINYMNQDGETALMWAERSLHVHIMDILEPLVNPPPPPPLQIRLKQADYDKYTNKSSDDFCSICLTNYNDMPLSIVNECKHIYHEKCITDWKKTGHNNCPKCNKNIKNIQQLIIDTTPGEPSTDKIFLGGYYHKYQKYLNKLK